MKISFGELDRGEYAPRWYGFSYDNWKDAYEIFYPIPINLLVKYGRKLYWNFLKLFYWVGLIDIGEAEAFYWDAFYRIKVH